MTNTLTGKTRYRHGESWGNKFLVLQVEESTKARDLDLHTGRWRDFTYVRWRDATIEDLSAFSTLGIMGGQL